MNKSIFIAAILTGGIAIAVAERPAGGAADKSAISPISLIEAEALWREDCASCHGRDGKGETRAGRRAGAPDMTSEEFHESAPDEQAFKSVKKGKVDDKGAELKKPFGDELTDEQILGLIEYLRKFDPKHPRDLSEAALKKK